MEGGFKDLILVKLGRLFWIPGRKVGKKGFLNFLLARFPKGLWLELGETGFITGLFKPIFYLEGRLGNVRIG